MTEPTTCLCGLALTDATREPHTLNACYAAVLQQREQQAREYGALRAERDAGWRQAAELQRNWAEAETRAEQATAARDAALGALADARAVLASVVQWRTDLERLGLYGDQRGDPHLVSLAAATVVALLQAVDVPAARQP